MVSIDRGLRFSSFGGDVLCAEFSSELFMTLADNGSFIVRLLLFGRQLSCFVILGLMG